MIDLGQLEAMIRNVNPSVDMEKLVELVDPGKRGSVAFSYLC